MTTISKITPASFACIEDARKAFSPRFTRKIEKRKEQALHCEMPFGAARRHGFWYYLIPSALYAGNLEAPHQGAKQSLTCVDKHDAKHSPILFVKLPASGGTVQSSSICRPSYPLRQFA